MTDLDPLLDELSVMRLTPEQWTATDAALRQLDPSAPDPDRLTQIVFEARVQRRFVGGRAASTLPPTKQTSALPWVGLVCAAVLLAVGGALGGGLVLVGVAALGLFVFGIAMAGSRVAHRRPARQEESESEPVGIPQDVRDTIDRLRAG